MASSKTPLTLMGKQLLPPPKKNLYHTKSYMSEVDETLFGTPARFTQQGERRHLPQDKEWDPPWAISPTRKGLLHTEEDGKPRSKSKPNTPRSARSANKYRLRTHTPTYVDETLFGPKPKEPSFKPPWDDKDENARHLLWSPQVKDPSPNTPRSDSSSNERPGSRLGIYDDPYIPPTPRDSTSSARPVIKQRPGSSIKTPSVKPLTDANIRQKLDFSPKKDMDKDEIIERALQLARASQQAALESGRPSSARQAWRRPSSCTEHSLQGSARFRRAHLRDFIENEDTLSATGIKVPLSARSDAGSRPHSARLRSKSAQRPGSAATNAERPSWKP
ncbi:uncharacterized protein LOC143445902 isoform X2 [Clavelina lepadiformis]|uniref:uncharacterized protein LOC143445902 isoform X2 n=1 Tax=Clavelina lepadiformis TaxID=159417 RepID=UPI004042DB59